MEHDADTLKSPMTNYLESLNLALEENKDDPDELTKISTRLSADEGYLSAFRSRINEQISHLRSINTKKAEIADLIGRGIRERKDA